MANPVVTNVSGSNPGPVTAVPDFPQSSVGNTWKIGTFLVTLTPALIVGTTAAEQTFAATGIGLLTTDVVLVQKPANQAGLGIGGSRVSAADTLAINFVNATGATITPTAGEVYKVTVIRIQPNWAAPASGNQIDW